VVDVIRCVHLDSGESAVINSLGDETKSQNPKCILTFTTHRMLVTSIIICTFNKYMAICGFVLKKNNNFFIFVVNSHLQLGEISHFIYIYIYINTNPKFMLGIYIIII
jgi:hypothetical protein